MTQRFHFDRVDVERDSGRISVDNLVNGKAYKKSNEIFIPKDREIEARRTLLDHLIHHSNLNHSLSWYLTQQQAIAFGRLIERGNKNHNVENELIQEIFSRVGFLPQREFNVIDVGCGTGENAVFLMKLLQQKPISFKAYFPVDGSPYFIAMSLENMVNNWPVDLIVSRNRVIRQLTRREIDLLSKVVDDINFVNSGKSRGFAQSDIIKESPKLVDFLRKVDPKYESLEGLDMWWALCNDFRFGDEIKRGSILRALSMYYLRENIIKVKQMTCWPNYNLESLTERINLIRARGVIYSHFNEVNLVSSYTSIIRNIFEKPEWNEKDVATMITYFDLVKFLFGEYEIDYVVDFRKDDEYYGLEFSGFVGDILNFDFIQKIGLNVNDPDRTHQFYSLKARAHVGYISLFLGQTLGNFNQTQREQIISNLYKLSAKDNYVLIGVELRPEDNFNRFREECQDISDKYRREGAEFLAETVKLLGVDPSRLEFRAEYVYDDSQELISIGFEPNSIAMFYCVKQDVTFSDGNRSIGFKAGSIIPAGSSYKFRSGEVAELCRRVGFSYVDSKSFIPLPKGKEDTRPIYEVILARK